MTKYILLLILSISSLFASSRVYYTINPKIEPAILLTIEKQNKLTKKSIWSAETTIKFFGSKNYFTNKTTDEEINNGFFINDIAISIGIGIKYLYFF